MKNKRTRFTDDQRRDLASLVIDSGVTYADAAATVGVTTTTVRAWVAKERTRREGSGSPQTRDVASMEAEIRRLRAEVLRMKKEAEFLEKAAAFFASRRPNA